MDSKATIPPDDSSLNADLQFLSASALAANGRLEEAKALLSQDGQLPSSPQALDLLARISVQSDDLVQARTLWQAALQANPAYEPARQALDSLSSPWFALAAAKRIALLACISIAGCLAVVGLFALFRQLPQPATQPQSVVVSRSMQLAPRPVAADPPKPHDPVAAIPASDAADAVKRLAQSFELRAGQLDAQIQTLQQSQANLLAGQERLIQLATTLTASNHFLLSQQQASLDLAERTRRELRTLSDAYASDHRISTNSTPPPATVPSLNLSLDGITVEPCNGGWNLQFRSALFDRDDHLKIGSKAQIESVAKALVRTQAKIHIQIVGYADNEPPTWPWSNPLSDAHLGQLRAERIKQILARMSLFPATALSATNAATGDLPHPGDSRRNRTVVLRISQPD